MPFDPITAELLSGAVTATRARMDGHAAAIAGVPTIYIAHAPANRILTSPNRAQWDFPAGLFTTRPLVIVLTKTSAYQTSLGAITPEGFVVNLSQAGNHSNAITYVAIATD